MKKHLLNSAAGAFALFIFAAVPALAQEFEEWDSDDEVGLSAEEFETGFDEVGIFDEWDADDDGLLSGEEFNAGVYAGYDDDDDGLLDEEEFGEYGEDDDDGGFWDF